MKPSKKTWKRKEKRGKDGLSHPPWPWVSQKLSKLLIFQAESSEVFLYKLPARLLVQVEALIAPPSNLLVAFGVVALLDYKREAAYAP
jgi:hypothetical protein